MKSRTQKSNSCKKHSGDAIVTHSIKLHTYIHTYIHTYRLLRPGGLLLFSEPDGDNSFLESLYKVFLMHAHIYIHTHTYIHIRV